VLPPGQLTASPSIASVTPLEPWAEMPLCFDFVSTVGDSPVAVIVSSTCPISSCTFTVAVNVALTRMSFRTTVLNPCSSNQT
jgi:hypothetical protein